MSEYERLIKRLIFLLRLKGCLDRMIINLTMGPFPELNYLSSTFTQNIIEDPLKKESNTYQQHISALDVIKPLEPRKRNMKFEMEYLGTFVKDKKIKKIEPPPDMPERKLYPLDKNIFIPLKSKKIKIRFEDL